MRTVDEVLKAESDLGEHTALADALDRNLIIREFELLDTSWGDAAVIAVTEGEVNHTVLTWSQVLISQLLKIEKYLPVLGQITQIKNYYCFVAPDIQEEDIKY